MRHTIQLTRMKSLYLTKLLVCPRLIFWSSTWSESVGMGLQGPLLVRLSYYIRCTVNKISSSSVSRVPTLFCSSLRRYLKYLVKIGRHGGYDDGGKKTTAAVQTKASPQEHAIMTAYHMSVPAFRNFRKSWLAESGHPRNATA